MEIKQLRYFIAVADTLSFSRAAESVYLSQSALSRQIAELEKEVGAPLFTRSTRKVALTDAGRALQLQAKELISRWEKLVPEVRDAVAAPLRTLTVGMDSRALAHPARRLAFADLICRLRQEHPGLRVLVRRLDYQELLQGLFAESLDCALILDREAEQRSDLCQQILGGEEMVLAFRSANPHRDGDHADVIMNRGLILVDKEPQGLSHILRILSDLRLEPQIRFCESLEDMTTTVETGESAAILPESVVAKLADPALQILRLPSAYSRLQLSLLYRRACENPMLPPFRARAARLGEIDSQNA